jgi:TonB family protein
MMAKHKKQCDELQKENESLKKKLAAANKQISQLKKNGGGPGVTPEQAALLKSFENYVNPMQKVTESLKKWRSEVVALTEERDALKKQVEGAKTGGVNQEQIDLIREKLLKVRAEVVKYMEKQGEIVEAVASTGPTMVKMTMDTIKDLKYYTVTGDLAELKKEWFEAELGELDDEDFQLYLNRAVRVIEIEEDDEEFFMVVENMPEFPGGDLGLMKFIQKNVRYPAIAKEYNITGKVYVSFIVDKQGNVTNVKIVRGVDKNLDSEALRVVSSLPKYKPGKQRGKPVRVMFTIPINFTLN